MGGVHTDLASSTPEWLVRMGSLVVFGCVLFWALLSTCDAISCTSELQSLSCLPVFSHSPSSLSKCYCSSTCPDIETLRHSCFSGQLQTDPCGVCLQCAPGFGEKCGGFGNAEGVCAGGLGCLIKYQPGLETEQNKTGTCVTEQREECRNPESGVSCRPGQLGVPSDFVFCPDQCRKGSNRNTGGNTGFLFDGPPRENKNAGETQFQQGGQVGQGGQGGQLVGPGVLGQTIGQGVRDVVNNVPESVKDSVRELLS